MANKSNKREKVIILSFISFLLSAICGALQAWIIYLYIESAVAQDWSYFTHLFGKSDFVRSKNDFCFDRCVPNLPFELGWASISFFTVYFVLTLLIIFRLKHRE